MEDMSMRAGSLFTGVGGFDLGMEAAGWTTEFQVEWDAKCNKILETWWPDVPRWEDISHVNGADLPPVDLITFGSPCQDMSIAGQRSGLNGGERSILFHEAMRIVKEMRDATNNELPRWIVWENVVGSLSSSGGRDFGAVLDSMADVGALVVEWAVLDARWFGVPQRRRRVFVVACFDPATAGRCTHQILPVAARGERHPAPLGEEEPAVAGTLGGGTPNGGPKNDLDRMAFIPAVPAQIGTITKSAGLAGAKPEHVVAATMPSFANQLLARDAKGPPSRIDAGEGNTIPFHTTQTPISGDNSHTPTVTGGSIGIVDNLGVRRLTPTECERLMGWPDDHTKWYPDGSQQADSHRYQQCGNGVASPVAAWIGKILAAIDTNGGQPQ